MRRAWGRSDLGCFRLENKRGEACKSEFVDELVRVVCGSLDLELERNEGGWMVFATPRKCPERGFDSDLFDSLE